MLYVYETFRKSSKQGHMTSKMAEKFLLLIFRPKVVISILGAGSQDIWGSVFEDSELSKTIDFHMAQFAKLTI